MPAWGKRLNEDELRVIAGWVLAQGNAQGQ
jgi:mono/diheme cytochrome c family protein